MFPTISEYNQAIARLNESSFRTLRGISFIPSRTVPMKIFSYGAGSYAVVFKGVQNRMISAVRCFISAESENIERCRKIAQYLSSMSESWITKLDLLDNEIYVNESYYPVITMPWIDGDLLNNFIGKNIDNNGKLTSLQQEIVKVNRSMESLSVGHGDVQSGNVIVQTDFGGACRIRLIDYDGMYVPSLSGRLNLERGRSEFQHPRRTPGLYNERMDRFSWWVILAGLEAIKWDKSLWFEVMSGGFNTLDNVLFIGNDFTNPSGSRLFQKLYALNQPSINFYLAKLEAFCKMGPDQIEAPRMYNHEAPVIHVPPVSVVAQETDAESVLILSSPSTIKVLSQNLSVIGTTPVKLSRKDYLNKSVLLVYDSQVQNILIDGTRSEYFAEFQPQQVFVSQNSVPQVKFQTTTPPPFEFVPTPIPGPSVPPPEEPSSAAAVWWPIIIILIIFILFAVFTNSSRNSYGEVEEQETEAPSTVFGHGPAVTKTQKQNLPQLTEEYSTLNLYAGNDPTSLQYKDDNGQTALDILKSFLISIDKQDCDGAWKVSFYQKWEKSGRVCFCSEDGFGGVRKVIMGKHEIVKLNTSYAKLRVNIFMMNYTKGNKCYRQEFELKKLLNVDDLNVWRITEVADLITPFEVEYLELKS